MSDWLSARAWPACFYRDTPKGEKLVLLGGDTKSKTDPSSTCGTDEAIMLSLAESNEPSVYQRAHQKDLRARLQAKSGEGLWSFKCRAFPLQDCSILYAQAHLSFSDTADHAKSLLRKCIVNIQAD